MLLLIKPLSLKTINLIESQKIKDTLIEAMTEESQVRHHHLLLLAINQKALITIVMRATPGLITEVEASAPTLLKLKEIMRSIKAIPLKRGKILRVTGNHLSRILNGILYQMIGKERYEDV